MHDDLAKIFTSNEAFEYFKYCVKNSMVNCPLNNFIVLISVGDNGKSTFIDTLVAVFEKRYYSRMDSKSIDAASESSKVMNSVKPDTLFVFMDETEKAAKKESTWLQWPGCLQPTVQHRHG